MEAPSQRALPAARARGTSSLSCWGLLLAATRTNSYEQVTAAAHRTSGELCPDRPPKDCEPRGLTCRYFPPKPRGLTHR